MNQRGKKVVSVNSGKTTRSQPCLPACCKRSISRLTTAGRRSLRWIGPIWQAPTVISRDISSLKACAVSTAAPARKAGRGGTLARARGWRQQPQQGPIEAVRRLVGYPMARSLDQSDLELGMMPPQDREPPIERAAGDDVLAPPNGFDRGRDLREGFRQAIAGRERAAAEARAFDVLGLQMHGERVDVVLLGEHQHPEVLMEDGGNLSRAHAGAAFGKRLPRLGRQPERRDADQDEIADASAQFS